MQVNVTAQVADGHTMEQFGRLIRERQKWLGESTADSVAACALQTLKSLRTLTKSANPRKTKVGVQPMSSLNLSFYSKGGAKPIPCLRTGKIRYIPAPGIYVRYKSLDKTAKVFKYVYTPLNGRKPRTYLIVANSQRDAVNEAKSIVARRAQIYKGLAKRAFGALMYKACTLNPRDAVSQAVNKVADDQTNTLQSVRRTSEGAVYQLDLYDNLLYAALALKNGKNDIDLSFQKASNKIVSVINMKCRNILGFEKIESPFPDIKGKRQ